MRVFSIPLLLSLLVAPAAHASDGGVRGEVSRS
jgi:hypothetical protein